MGKSTKTAAERAGERLATANNVLARLDKKVDRLAHELEAAKAERKEATAKRDYAALDPALPKQGGEE